MTKKSTRYAELTSRWLKTVGVGFIIVFGSLTLTVIIRDHDKRMSPFKPMITEAKELDISFDQAIKSPDKYLNKHVIWCVQNRSKSEVNYQGDSTKSLFIFNYQQMPLEFGSKHSSCADMLLQIKGAKQNTRSGTVGAMFVLAF